MKDRYSKGEAKTKKADLIGYIREIEKIKEEESPDWGQEAKKAHAIRKQRNLVHAKLCLNTDVEMDEETCKMVVGYLIDIINTRHVEK